MINNGRREGAPAHNDHAKAEPAGGGEDDGSTEKNGDDSHLHEDQKSPRLKT